MTDRGYRRISLETERSGSLGKQTAQVEKHSNDVVWYEDASVSGSKVPFAMRPGGAELLADLRAGDRVLVTKIDRCARSVRDLLNTVEHIKQVGATIVFVEQRIDTGGPMGEFLLTLLGAIAQLEAAIIAERRKESLEQFAQEGRHAQGRAPFGFRSVENPNGRGLVIRPHPEESAVLLDAIARVMGGETQDSVADAIGIHRSRLHLLMRNPRLAGMTPQNGGVVMVNGHPRIDPDAAILSITEWKTLQAMFNPNKSYSRHDGIGAALTCGTCGERLYYGSPTYRCTRKNQAHKDGAPGASVVAVNAEAHVERLFLEQYGSQRGLVVEEVGSNAERDEAIAIAEIRLQEVRRQMDNASTEEEEDALDQAHRAARRGLREAKALPSGTRLELRPSGRTQAEDWAEADSRARVAMLRSKGDWVVQPGAGMPIEKKVVLREHAPDLSEVYAQLTPGIA